MDLSRANAVCVIRRSNLREPRLAPHALVARQRDTRMHEAIRWEKRKTKLRFPGLLIGQEMEAVMGSGRVTSPMSEGPDWQASSWRPEFWPCTGKHGDFRRTFLIGLLVFAWLVPPTAVAGQAGGGELSCGLISNKSDLPGVSLVITSKKCSFSQSELRKGVRIDYELIVDREIPGVVPLPQDMTGCQKPGSGGLITFRVISGNGYSFCPECDLGPCPKPASKNPTTLRPGHYAESVLWYGHTFIGDGEGMTTLPRLEFPPFPYVLRISARGRRQSVRKGEPAVPFTIALEYRVNITVNDKDEDKHSSYGGNLP